MKLLITGVAGSIGRRLINALQHHSTITIHGCDIQPLDTGNLLFLNPVHFKQVDLRSPEFTNWVTSVSPDVVIHLASILQISKHMTRDMAYDIDVLGTKRLLQACAQCHVKKFIITTSGAAYGYFPENQETITEERSPRGNQEYFYSAHKAEIEDILAVFRTTEPHLKQLIFRPGAIVGPNFQGPVVDLLKQKVIVGLQGVASPFNFIWSEDVVAYLIEGAVGPITGQFNLAGDGTLTMREIAQMLNKPYLPLPELLVKAALAIVKPLGLSQYGPEQTRFIKYRPVLDNSKLKLTFSHQPTYNSQEALAAFLQAKPSSVEEFAANTTSMPEQKQKQKQKQGQKQQENSY